MRYEIRQAAPCDAGALLAIYAPYVRETAITFETEVPTVCGFAARIEAIGARYPYLVCLAGGEIAGFAYASRHRERDAYRFDVDVSVYVAPGHQGAGVAKRLYGALFSVLAELGCVNAYAAYTEPNVGSRSLHERFGFTLIGTHRQTGYKLGRWHDVTWMEKRIREPANPPVEPRQIADLSRERLAELLTND